MPSNVAVPAASSRLISDLHLVAQTRSRTSDAQYAVTVPSSPGPDTAATPDYLLDGRWRSPEANRLVTVGLCPIRHRCGIARGFQGSGDGHFGLGQVLGCFLTCCGSHREAMVSSRRPRFGRVTSALPRPPEPGGVGFTTCCSRPSVARVL